MISSFSHRPSLRVAKLLRDTEDDSWDATIVSPVVRPLISAGGWRRAEMIVRFQVGTVVVSSLPSLSCTDADADGIPRKISVPCLFIVCSSSS